MRAEQGLRRKTSGKARGLLVLAGLIFLALPAFAQSGSANVLYLEESVVRKSIRTRVDPEMPAAARQFHIYGDVLAQFTIGLDGKVESIDDAKGNQLLKASAVTALKKWVFVPFTHDGSPVKVKTAITFAFKP
jgi:protein TonB